jgi:hypothetical protein
VNHQPESRVREIRLHGSEGGAAGSRNRPSLPSPPEWLSQLAWWTLIAAVVVAIVSGVRYARKIFSAAREAEREPAGVDS